MPECLQRGKKEHPRSRIAHDGAYPLPHITAVTVYAAASAGILAVPERTPVQPGKRICQQFAAVMAQLRLAMLMPAIESYHEFDCPLLSAYLSHAPGQDIRENVRFSPAHRAAGSG